MPEPEHLIARLDPTVMSRTQEAVEKAWTQTHARENARQNARLNGKQNARIYVR